MPAFVEGDQEICTAIAVLQRQSSFRHCFSGGGHWITKEYRSACSVCVREGETGRYTTAAQAHGLRNAL